MTTRAIDLDEIVAIDVHTHAERLPGRATGSGDARGPGGGRGVLRRPSAAADRPGGRRLLPRAADAGGDLHRRRRGRHGPPADRQRRRAGGRTRQPRRADPVRERRPAQGQARRAARPASWSRRGVRGFKFHPNTQAFWPNDRDHYPLYEVIAEAGLIALFHSGTTGIGAGMPGGGGVKLKYSNPMLRRRRRGRLPGARDHPRASLVPVAGRGAGDRRAQAERVHRSQRLGAEVLPGEPDPVHEHAAEAQDAVRLRLPADHSGPLAVGVRASCRSRTRSARWC